MYNLVTAWEVSIILRIGDGLRNLRIGSYDLGAQEKYSAMEKSLLFALVIGLTSGLAIGLQGTLNSWAGRLIGSISNGLLVNLTGGIIAGFLLLLVGNRYIQNW